MKNFMMGAMACIAALVAFGNTAHAILIFDATLEGGQEVPPVATGASGMGLLSLNDAQDRLEINLQLFGLDLDGNQTLGNPDDDVVAAHIHNAPVGLNGGVVFGFIGPNSDTNGDLVIDPVAGTIFSAWDLAEGAGTTLDLQLPSLLAGNLYFNVHTALNPAGEIRGQIARVPEPASMAMVILGLAAISGLRRRYA